MQLKVKRIKTFNDINIFNNPLKLYFIYNYIINQQANEIDLLHRKVRRFKWKYFQRSHRRTRDL